MTALPSSKPATTVGELVRRRLREIGRSPHDLAEAVGVPAQYIDDLITGSRRPPMPGRTDIYGKMTSFLQLRRNEVVDCAHAERSGATPAAAGPEAGVRRLLLSLCAPETARELERRRTRRGSAELAGFAQRLLDVAQGAVRKELDDQVGLRLTAAKRGDTYLAARLRILEFLDVTADTLTAEDLLEFLRPRIARWDVDLKTGVLRVVMRASEPRERPSRREPPPE